MPSRSAAERVSPAPATPRRSVLRGALAAVALAAVSGCGIDVDDIRWDDDGPLPRPTPGPDELARRRGVDSAQALLAACTAAASARPDARSVLEAVALQHSAHLVALGVRPLQTPPPSRTSPPESATPTGPPSTATPGTDVLGDLVGQHSAAASQAMTDTTTTSGPLARLLAQIAAARAVQARSVAAALGQPAPPDPAPVPSSTGFPTTSATTTAPPGAPRTASSSPSPTAPLGDDVAAAVSAALEGEHAAVYGYQALTVRLADGARQQGLAAIAAHQNVVDQLEAVLRRAGGTPPVAAPAYRLPGPISDAAQATALAAQLESSLAALDADLIAVSKGELRALAVDLLLQRALAAFSWGAPPTAFPAS
jgi:Domain of unknown function (DUF4439)